MSDQQQREPDARIPDPDAAATAPAADPVAEAASPISVELPPELDYFRSSEAYRVELDSYYGPLDLLLYLIQKDEMDIYDIPIGRITATYLEYVEMIEALSLENAGEFLVMAATLLRIKSRLLLPTQSPEEEMDEDDPRAELVRRLLEYKRFKEMAENFKRLEEQRRRFHVRQLRPAQLEVERPEPELKLGLFDLLNALSGVFDRVSKTAVHEVDREVFTVEEKVELILTRLAEEETIRFDELFRDDAIRMEVVVTLIAVLELAKGQKIRLMQSETHGMIWVKAVQAKRPALEEAAS